VQNSGIGMKPFIDLAGASNANGVVFPIGKIIAADALPDTDPQKSVITSFISDYTTYTGNPPSHFAAHAWDSIMIVEQALASMPDGLALQEQRAHVRDSIEALQEFVGVDGVFNFSSEDHVGLSSDDVVLARIVDGDWQYFPPEEW